MKIKSIVWLALIALMSFCYACEDADDNTPLEFFFYDVAPSAWVGNVDGFSTYLEVPEITENVFYNGAVLVYMIMNENTADASFAQLPYTWVDHNIMEYMDYNAYIGGIDIQLKKVVSGINQSATPLDTYTFKVVVMEDFELPVIDE